MASPRVSVVIPTFNRAKTIASAVASALAQNFEDLFERKTAAARAAAALVPPALR